MRRRMVGLLLYEDEIRSVEGPDARGGGPLGTALSLTEVLPRLLEDWAEYIRVAIC